MYHDHSDAGKDRGTLPKQDRGTSMRAPWLPPEEERRGLLRFGRKRVAHESDGDVDAATDSASASASDGGSDPKPTGGSPKRSEGSTSRAGKTSDDTGAKKPAAPSTPPWLTGVRAPILGDDDDIAAPSDNVRPNDPEPDPSDSADQQDRYSESAQDEDSGAFESQTDFDQHEGIASLKFSLPPLSDEGIESESVSDYEGRESTLLEGSGGGRAISTALSDDAPTSPGPDLVVPDPLSRFGQLEAKLKQLGLDHSIPDRAAKHASQVESASVGESADGDSGSVEVSSDVADSGVGVDDSLGALGLEYPVSEFGEAAGVAPDTDTEGDAWYAGTGGAVLGGDAGDISEVVESASQVESASVGESADGDSGSVEVSSDVADSGVGVDDSLGALGLEYPVSEFGEAAGVAPDTDTQQDEFSLDAIEARAAALLEQMAAKRAERTETVSGQGLELREELPNTPDADKGPTDDRDGERLPEAGHISMSIEPETEGDQRQDTDVHDVSAPAQLDSDNPVGLSDEQLESGSGVRAATSAENLDTLGGGSAILSTRAPGPGEEQEDHSVGLDEPEATMPPMEAEQAVGTAHDEGPMTNAPEAGDGDAASVELISESAESEVANRAERAEISGPAGSSGLTSSEPPERTEMEVGRTDESKSSRSPSRRLAPPPWQIPTAIQSAPPAGPVSGPAYYVPPPADTPQPGWTTEAPGAQPEAPPAQGWGPDGPPPQGWAPSGPAQGWGPDGPPPQGWAPSGPPQGWAPSGPAQQVQHPGGAGMASPPVDSHQHPGWQQGVPNGPWNGTGVPPQQPGAAGRPDWQPGSNAGPGYPAPPGNALSPVRAEPPPNYQAPQAYRMPPSLDEAQIVNRGVRAPRAGWRRAIHTASGGHLNPGDSKKDRDHAELVARIRQPIMGDFRIAVLSIKGGVGKTTTTLGLGSAFSMVRSDRIIAVDANPDRGTLAERVRDQSTHSTVRDLLSDTHINSYADVRNHTRMATSRLEVLASEQDPAVSEAFGEIDYRHTIEILQRYYNIILTDCGTGIMHSAMAGVLDLAHSIVLVSSPAMDAARSASATLDWLMQHGHSGLVREAHVVLSASRAGSVGIKLDKVYAHFEARCKSIHMIPFDPHLAEGADVDFNVLNPDTNEAYLKLAGAIADNFSRLRAPSDWQ
ncbi:ESX-1 secretion-associated protein EspI [Mycobacteroides abscessus subsp. abscessus]|nr:ESX-1 secretion-associated protein EspI [Mycobacteroides abscessus subsp. abscessus]